MTKRVLQGVVVGAGFMGRTHLAAYASRKDVKIVCVVDRDTQKAEGLARPHGCEVRTDLAQALQDWQIDFVDVCLPSTFHRSAVTTALGAKAHVLVEKPFATTLEDVDAMIEAAESADRRLMVAHVCRFMPQYRYLDIANWLFGEPTGHDLTEISLKSGAGPSHVISRLAYPSTGSVTIEASHLMPKNYPFNAGFRLVAEHGTLECGEALTEYTDKGATRILLEEGDSYHAEIHHFLDCLATGEAFRISPREARLAVETVLKLRGTPA